MLRSRFSRHPLLVLLMVLLLPSPAAAHQQLLSSSPEEGAVLQVVPTELRFTFNQNVEPALASLTLMGPAGEVALAPHRVSEDAPKVLRALIEGRLAAGDYTATWLVTGDDGHAVRGELHFAIAEGAAGVAAADSVPAAPAEGAPTAGETGAKVEAPPVTAPAPDEAFSTGSPLYGAVRWLTFATIVIVTGAVAFALLLVPGIIRRAGGAANVPELGQVRARAAAVGLVAAGALAVAAALRLLAQRAALGAAGEGGGSALLQAMLTRTTWGWGWLLQVGATLVLIPALITARRGRRGGWVVAALAVFALASTPALSGHAVATSMLALVADTLHVLAAGGWLGTLLLMLVVGVPVLLTHPESRQANAAALLGAFSPLALTFAALVVLTGVYSASAHIADWQDLFGSAYGRTLLIKLALLLLLFGFGAYNWRRARPAVQRSGDAGPLRRSATAELALGALVLAVTAALVATPPPAEEAAAPPAAQTEVG